MNNNFYKINELTQHKYYQIPKELYTNPKYKTVINNDAKILYALLLDRMELSRMNEWVDEDGTIFLMFKREDLADMLGLCVTTVWRAFKQLKEVGLIAEKRQGLNRPNIIYIGKIQYENDTSSEQGDIFVPSESENINVQTDKTLKSGALNSKSQNLENLIPNKTKKNITDNIITKINDTESKKANAEEKNIKSIDSS